MNVELTAANPTEVEADVLAMAAGGLGVRKLDALFEGRLVRAAATADPVAVVPVTREVRARSIALVKLEAAEPGDLQLAAARAVRAHVGGGTLAWALDDTLPIAMRRQVSAGRRRGRPRCVRPRPLEEQRAQARSRPLRRVRGR